MSYGTHAAQRNSAATPAASPQSESRPDTSSPHGRGLASPGINDRACLEIPDSRALTLSKALREGYPTIYL